MKAKHLTEAERTAGKTCCFEIARNGVLGQCRLKAVAKLGGKYLCLEHFRYASSITDGCEYVLDGKNTVKSAAFLESLGQASPDDSGDHQGKKKRIYGSRGR